MAFADKWMELENIMLSEISQSQKTKGWMFSLISGEWYIMGVGEWGVREEWGNFSLCRMKWEGGGMKNGGMRQTSLPYVHVWLHEWYESTSCTKIETKVVPHFCVMILKNQES